VSQLKFRRPGSLVLDSPEDENYREREHEERPATEVSSACQLEEGDDYNDNQRARQVLPEVHIAWRFSQAYALVPRIFRLAAE
jgi:hypothetical protein